MAWYGVLLLSAVFFIASIVSAQNCSTQQDTGSCLYFYENVHTAGICPEGIMASFVCRGQVPADSTVDIRWYWTRNEVEAGTLGTLIQNNGSRYITMLNMDPPTNGRTIFFSILNVHNFSDTDAGFYWCQMVINGSRLLESSCPMEITAVPTNGTSGTDICEDTGMLVSRKCADFIVITETSQFSPPTPSLPTAIMSESSLLPESSSALPGGTSLSGMESSSEELTPTATPVPMDTGTPSSSSSSSSSSSLSSAVYGALGAAAVVIVLVGGVLVGLLVCVYLHRRKKLKGKAKKSRGKEDSSIALEKLGDNSNEPAVPVEYAVVQMKETRDALEATRPLQHGPSSYDKEQGVPSDGETVLSAAQFDEIHNPTQPDITAAPVNNSLPEQHHDIENNPDLGTSPQAKTLTLKGNHRHTQTGPMNTTTEANSGKHAQQEDGEENTEHEYEPIPAQQMGRQLAPAATGKQTHRETVNEDADEPAEYTHITTRASTVRATLGATNRHTEQSSGSTTNPSDPHLYHVLEGVGRGNPEDEKEIEEGHYYSTVMTNPKGTHKANTNRRGSLNEAATQPSFDDPAYDVSPQPSRRAGGARAVEAIVPPKTGTLHLYHTLEGTTPVENDNEYDYCAPRALLKPRVKAAVSDKSSVGQSSAPMKPVAAAQMPAAGIQALMAFDNPQYESSSLTPTDDRELVASGSDCKALFDDSMYAVTTHAQEQNTGHRNQNPQFLMTRNTEPQHRKCTLKH